MNRKPNRSHQGGPPSKGRKQKSPFSGWSILLWLIMLAIVVPWIWSLMQGNGGAVQISYSKFTEDVKAGQVSQVTITGDTIQGELNKPATKTIQGGLFSGSQTIKYTTFTTYVPIFGDNQLLNTLRQNGVEIVTQPQSNFPWGVILLNAIPFLLLLGIGYYFLTRMRSQGQNIFSMGKSRAKLYDRKKEGITFDDVAGIQRTKRELEEIIEYLKAPIKFQRLGGKIPKGVLLVGPPGTGKTLLARAVAGEANVPFFNITGSDFMEMFVGVGASRVRDLFQEAKKAAPSIIFIDELDSIGRRRGAGLGGGHDERELPERDRYVYSQEYMLDRLAVMMGGRAAEQLVLNTSTSGAENDLKQATRLARKMVLDWGMSERLGHIALGGAKEQVFLGEELTQRREYSESTASEVDEEITAILDEAYTRARNTLQKNRKGLDRLADELIEKEEIPGERVMEILKEVDLVANRKNGKE